MSEVTREQIEAAIKGYIEPHLEKNLVEAKSIKDVEIKGEQVKVKIVLGFPANDFLGQEPGTEKQIKTFCRLTYSVKFPMFEKTRAREDVADPLYLKLGQLAGEFPRWNFHKYLLDRDGNLVGSYRSSVTPEKLTGKIESLL